jgi:thermitase
MRSGAALLALLLIAPLAVPLGSGQHVAPPLVRLAILTHSAVEVPAGSPTVGGNPRAGFLVVETRSPAILRALFGNRVLEDIPAFAAATPNDPLWTSQWGPEALNMTKAWDIENGSTTVKVAVIDSGLDDQHPDFAGVPIEDGPDLVDHDFKPDDASGHGTHVAGIIAAARNNGVGIAGIARVTLIPIRVLDANGHGSCLNVALAVLEAAARGASIINLSLECAGDYPPLHLAIESVTRAGVLVVAAAGNVGEGPCPAYPGAYPEVLSVTALANTTAASPSSCRGPYVELAAPGVDILSTWPGGGYRNLSGTSMAAPHVTGIAALLKAKFPAMNGSDIRHLLDSTAADIGPPGRDNTTGFGRVDPVAALLASPETE